MTTYELYTKNGHVYEITESEYEAVIASQDSKIVFPRINVTVGENMIADIRPKSLKTKDMLEERAKMTEGYLHDGKRAVKQFGQWMDPEGQYDANGRMLTRFDPQYYPEVSRDAVAPLEMWEQIQELPREQRLEKMLSTGRPALSDGAGPESMKQIFTK